MNKMNLYQIVASLGLISGFSSISVANGLDEVPRGRDIEPLAANCNIGLFPQVSKAGPYNALCNVMQDSEKCLALIKGAFHYNGETVKVFPIKDQDRGRYCLNVLKNELGLAFE
jgi:hypothetical protein